MERLRTIFEKRNRSVAFLVAVANIAFTGLLSESRVVLTNDVINATSFGQNTFEANRQPINQLSGQEHLKLRYLEMAHDGQYLQRHGRKPRLNRVTDVTRNPSFSESGSHGNDVLKFEDPYKVLEYAIDQGETIENSGERAEGQRAKKEEEVLWLALQAKLTLNPVNGYYDEKELREMAAEHEKEIDENFSCYFPVPEVICIKSINTDVTKDYYPRCTVVFRCRPRSGCCENGYVCRVKNSSNILRAFTEISHMDETSSGRIQLFRFTNHTECVCKPIADFQDDCLDCPESFERRQRESGRCECYCDRESHNYKLCLSRTQGLRQLPESDLRCVEQNNCSKPQCAYGAFNVKTGFCPCNRKDGLQRRKCENRQNI